MSNFQDPSGQYPPALPTGGDPGAWKPRVLDPLTQAFEVMIARITGSSGSLLRYWIVVAFTVFIVTCGRGPLSLSYSKPTDLSTVQAEMGIGEQTNPFVAKAFELVFDALANGSMLIAFGVLGTLLVLLFRYFSSRFEFILIAQVAENRVTLGDAWERYRDAGHSLYAFHAIMVVSIAMFNIFATFVAHTFFPATPQSIQGQGSMGEVLEQISSSYSYFDLAMLPLVTIGSLCLFLLGSFVLNFVVPIMYRQNRTFLDAGGVAFKLFTTYPIAFCFYLFMRYLVMIVGGLITTVVGLTLVCLVLSPCICLTCFIPPAGLLLIPFTLIMVIFYVVFGVVVSVPLKILMTAYSLKFLEQFGEGFDFFADNTANWQGDYPPMAPVPYGTTNPQQGPFDPPPHP